jgi:protease-4
MRQLIVFLASLVVAAGCCTGLGVKTLSKVHLAPPPLPVTPATEQLYEMPLPGDAGAQSKIAVVDVDGLLLNMDMTGLGSRGENPVELFREKLDCVAGDPQVCAIVLRINSPGGGVAASDMMWHDLVTFKQRHCMPVVACLMDIGTGGAYYLATAADHIVAHPTTVTGGMGVILNLYNLQDMMAQFNVIATPIRSGDRVDMGSPVRAMSPDTRKILQDMADEFHLRFQNVVQHGRLAHDPGRNEDFDGRIFTAQQALEHGLVDQIGYLDDALCAAKAMAKLSAARVVIYHRNSDRARNAYATTPNVPLQSALLPLSVPGLDRSKLPTFLYLWQPDPTLEKLGGR